MALWEHKNKQEDELNAEKTSGRARVPRSRDLLVDKSRIRHQRDFVSTGTSADVTSCVITLKFASVHGPNEVTIATSVASRPRTIKMRPMRGLL